METLSPVRSSRVRNLAILVLSAAAVLGHVSPAHAQAGGPFGVPCDSTGVNGIPYVPGVNCRLMAVDGYTRKYIVLVPPGGVPAGSPAVFMLHGASGDGDSSWAVPAGGKRQHRKTSSPSSQRRSNTSFWRPNASRHAGTTTTFPWI